MLGNHYAFTSTLGHQHTTFGNTAAVNTSAEVPKKLINKLEQLKDGIEVTTTSTDLFTLKREGDTVAAKYTYLREVPGDNLFQDNEWVYPKAKINLNTGVLTLTDISRSNGRLVSEPDKQFFTEHFIQRITQDIDWAITKSNQ